LQKDAESALDIIRGSGGAIILPKDDALEGFRAAAKDYAQAWIDKHKSDKFDAKAYFNRMVELLAKYKD
jgi:hypothetical protein